jgi:hypothetical protein
LAGMQNNGPIGSFHSMTEPAISASSFGSSLASEPAAIDNQRVPYRNAEALAIAQDLDAKIECLIRRSVLYDTATR